MLLGGCAQILLCYELDAKFPGFHLPAVMRGVSRIAKGHAGAVCDEKSEDLARLKNQLPIPRDAVDYIIETFPIVRRKDEDKVDGDYRTKGVILEVYGEMAEATSTGIPYKTRLAPRQPPGRRT